MAMRREDCADCGGEAKTVRTDYDASQLFGVPVTLLNIEVVRCAKCGDSPILFRAARIHRRIAMQVIRKRYRLTGAEVRFLRKFVQMKGEDFAKLLHVDRTTLSKWENDEDQVGEQSDRLIRAIAL